MTNIIKEKKQRKSDIHSQEHMDYIYVKYVPCFPSLDGSVAAEAIRSSVQRKHKKITGLIFIFAN